MDDWDDYDEYYDDDKYQGGRNKVGKAKGDAPGDNQKQKEQFDHATKGLDKQQKRRIHDEITGKGYGLKDIEDIANTMFPK